MVHGSGSVHAAFVERTSILVKKHRMTAAQWWNIGGNNGMKRLSDSV
jgi:hypothetical protein